MLNQRIVLSDADGRSKRWAEAVQVTCLQIHLAQLEIFSSCDSHLLEALIHRFKLQYEMS
jgi:hypothetical protein